MKYHKSQNGKVDIFPVFITVAIIAIIGFSVFIFYNSFLGKANNALQQRVPWSQTTALSPNINNIAEPKTPSTTPEPLKEQLLFTGKVSFVYDTAVELFAAQPTKLTVKKAITLNTNDPDKNVKAYVTGTYLLVPKSVFGNLDITLGDEIRVYGYMNTVSSPVTRFELMN